MVQKTRDFPPSCVKRTETVIKLACSTTGDEPTLLKLMKMKGADGNPLRIIPRIAAGDYMTFGMCLLQDENGDQVELVKRDHRQDGTESVTQAIIKKWLTSGAPTRTYQHLIECLRQSGLGALAEDIANTTAGEGVFPLSQLTIS